MFDYVFWLHATKLFTHMNPDIHKTFVSIDCESCGKTTQATLGQLINAETIACEHCKKEMNLKNYNEGTEKTEKKIKNAFAKLEKKLKQ